MSSDDPLDAGSSAMVRWLETLFSRDASFEDRELARRELNWFFCREPGPVPAARDAVTAALEARVNEIAERIVRQQGWDGYLQRDVQDDAVSHVWERLASYRPVSSLSTWCWRVIENMAIDIFRKRSRMRLDACDVETIYRESSEDDSASQRDWPTTELRADLDEVAIGLARNKSAIDSFAVLLAAVRFRCVVIADSAEYSRESSAFWDLIEQWCPWHAHECGRSFRAGYPLLGAIWNDLKSAENGGDVVAALTVNMPLIVNRLSGDEILTNATWRQWIVRAKAAAIEALTPRRYYRYLGRLLLDRPKRLRDERGLAQEDTL